MAHDPISAVVTALKREQIVPDVLPESFMPSLLFSIVYPNGREVMLGNEFTVEETQDEPSISFAAMNMPTEQADSADGEVGYTLAMLDPDAPSRAEPIYKSFRHWVITGLKSPTNSSITNANPTALQTHPAATPYRPPGPRPGSGLHRYIFLLFQEPSSESFMIPQGAKEYGATLEERRSWDPLEFATKYGLKLVGANFLLVTSAPAQAE